MATKKKSTPTGKKVTTKKAVAKSRDESAKKPAKKQAAATKKDKKPTKKAAAAKKSDVPVKKATAKKKAADTKSKAPKSTSKKDNVKKSTTVEKKPAASAKAKSTAKKATASKTETKSAKSSKKEEKPKSTTTAKPATKSTKSSSSSAGKAAKKTTKPKFVYKPEPSILDTPKDQPRKRYSDNELQEFKALIQGKLEAARKELAYLQGLITRKDEAGTDDTENKYMGVEDGSGTMEREQLSQLASRQIQFIDKLEKALQRIENKTYGICRETGKLIDKARLRAVPHATLSIEAKLAKRR